jgi:hypothetical protein
MVKIRSCKRCNHEWALRGKGDEPKTCPKCRSPYWDTEKKIKKEIQPRFPVPMQAGQGPGP